MDYGEAAGNEETSELEAESGKGDFGDEEGLIRNCVGREDGEGQASFDIFLPSFNLSLQVK